ncbi:MAG: fasciclin domain-containing protein [Gammaproteobacteria bacterium]|nr:fasciclin domain-containing protein [Gammaproteobacteria bacterium]
MRTLKIAFAALIFAVVAAQVQADDHGPAGTIVDVAREAGSFETLLTALDAASLTQTLQGDGPFTVFAPTDAAFAALPTGTLEGLLADPDALTAVLTYHVVAGRTTAAQVANLTSVTTLQGGDLSITSNDGVTVGDANVTAADVEASNGIIHVIDAVLIP